jgi:hypothetical protein
MRTKHLLMGTGILLAASALYAGRMVWRVKRQLVTLDVRNAPLAEVLRKVEWQTWKKIRAEKNLDARITLHVKDKPLSYVLDRLAEQAGAHWSTVYAVYNSSRAVKALDTVLRGDGKLEPAGWTKVAPKPPSLDEMPPSGAHFSGPKPGPDGSGPMGGGRRMMMMKRGPNGPVMFSGGSADGQMEMWSPEELVMETPLSPRLKSDSEEPVATAKAAAETARKVNGHWTTFVAFQKSAMGVGFRLPPASPNGPGGPGGPAFDPMKHNPNDRFARLTAEQRVQRARQHGGLVQQNVDRDVERKTN